MDTNHLYYGYLDRFDKYWLRFAINFSTFRYTLEHGGDKLEQMPIPQKPFFKIDDPDPHHFAYQTELDVESSVHSWETWKETPNIWYDTRWYIYCRKELKTSIGPIPKEILDQYPNMDLNGLKHQKSEITVGSDPENNTDWNIETYTFPAP